MPKFSICVPISPMKNGLGEKFLIEFFSHLIYQTCQDFEIVISDQSEDDIYKKICDTFSHIFDIKYMRNTKKGYAAANVNEAIRVATGEIIKLLYVDDFFTDQEALDKIYKAFKSNPEGKWLMSGFVHSDTNRTRFFDARMPWFGNKYVNGDNTTGNPSNFSCRKECVMEMDEELLFLVDGEYFYRSYYYYGDPILIPEVLVCFREHEDSAINKPSFYELKEKEMKYCEEKYKKLEESK